MRLNPATVLVVENGDMLRPLICEILQREGYQILAAKDAKEAIDVWERSQGRIDLVLTDVVMPGMSGKELVDHLRLKQADIKIIYMSGYESSLLSVGSKFVSGTTFLQKPFRPVELSTTVRELLGK
ncbi:MAG: response regulator [Deltaproteobacteria bacterium]|jgi:two-component system, cell cycle sensor histidine kinase and response regulator CckA